LLSKKTSVRLRLVAFSSHPCAFPFAVFLLQVGITAASSQQLCEQLRLILEPTLASKMQGDYQTGKRINMRKIIPYVASNFRKDKIWLRRSKPSKRTYQVMVALDDTVSMGPGQGNNNAGEVALEAMAMICKALSQLEVGEISVGSFGECFRQLHAFNDVFSDECGAEVLSNFRFDQTKTDIELTLKQIVHVLDTAAASTTKGNTSACSQIVFMISDGRFDQGGRDRIKSLIQELAEKQQLLVLIILDNTEDSILNLQEVKYIKNRVEVISYMETYPFPYYIVLKDINMLPESVADTLRQWFEMLNNV
jgi:midasin